MKRSKGARILAMICVVLLLGLYAATFIAALTAKPYASRMFMGCLLSTVFVPVFLHIMIRLFVHMTERKEGQTTLHELHKAKKEQKREKKDK